MTDEKENKGKEQMDADKIKQLVAENVSKRYTWSHRKFGIELLKSLPELHKYKEDGVTKYRGIALK
jgi:hypothetical protein